MRLRVDTLVFPGRGPRRDLPCWHFPLSTRGVMSHGRAIPTMFSASSRPVVSCSFLECSFSLFCQPHVTSHPCKTTCPVASPASFPPCNHPAAAAVCWGPPVYRAANAEPKFCSSPREASCSFLNTSSFSCFCCSSAWKTLPAAVWKSLIVSSTSQRGAFLGRAPGLSSQVSPYLGWLPPSPVGVTGSPVVTAWSPEGQGWPPA